MRNAANAIVQFTYGDDGRDPVTMEGSTGQVSPICTFCDVVLLALEQLALLHSVNLNFQAKYRVNESTLPGTGQVFWL